VKALRIAVLLGLLALIASAVAIADTVYPSVDFYWDQPNNAYIYTVTVTPNDTFPLGYLELDTRVQNAGLTAWTQLGPVANNIDLNWVKDYFEWDLVNHCDAAVWFVTTPEQEIYPSNWIGVFTLICPNSVPGEGFSLTMDGVEASANRITIKVPGPTVPEPTGLVAMASGVLGAGGILFRRRKA
jgi:hypothetical protein